MSEVFARIHIEGHEDDLYALSLLFPEGAYQGLHVVTGIIGRKERGMDRVVNAAIRETYVTGEDCLPLLEAKGIDDRAWMAKAIIAPLNGYAALSDSSFRGVVPVAVSWKVPGGSGGAVFGPNKPTQPSRLISVDRHTIIGQLRSSRMSFMKDNPLAAYAAAVLAEPPSWPGYYRLLEDIAGYSGTTLDKLDKIGLAQRKTLDAFKSAANNTVAGGRHGASKRRNDVQQSDLMTLLEAREFVRRVVSGWLDKECGGRMPHDRVNGGLLRFGLDEEPI